MSEDVTGRKEVEKGNDLRNVSCPYFKWIRDTFLLIFRSKVQERKSKLKSQQKGHYLD